MAFDIELKETLLKELPESEWRILGALARKREEAFQRKYVADQFNDLWMRENEKRKMIEMMTKKQYNQYLASKRQQQKMEQESRRLWKMSEQELKRQYILDCIQHKDRRNEDRQAFISDRKIDSLVDRAIKDEAKFILAADRRSRISELNHFKKELELNEAERRTDLARQRKNAKLRETSQRVAITNAMHTWESSMLLQEVTQLDMARRANHAARAALTEAKSRMLASAKERQLTRARQLAALSHQLRDMIRDNM